MNKFEWQRLAMKQLFNGEALRVLWCYQDHADADSLVTFPKIRDVATETGISVEKVGRYRRELLATGWLDESEEKTTRGNPKLVLAEGENIDERSYLGQKKAVSAKSMANLVPAAKQKKAAGSLDTPDESGLEHREDTGLEYREIDGLDTPDVTISELNNRDRTIRNNQETTTVASAPVVDDSPISRLEKVPDSHDEQPSLTTSEAKPNQWDGYQPKTRAEAAPDRRVGVRGTSMTQTSDEPLNEWISAR